LNVGDYFVGGKGTPSPKRQKPVTNVNTKIARTSRNKISMYYLTQPIPNLFQRV